MATESRLVTVQYFGYYLFDSANWKILQLSPEIYTASMFIEQGVIKTKIPDTFSVGVPRETLDDIKKWFEQL